MTYDWDMKVNKVEEHLNEYLTPYKNYQVRNGKVIIDN